MMLRGRFLYLLTLILWVGGIWGLLVASKIWREYSVAGNDEPDVTTLDWTPTGSGDAFFPTYILPAIPQADEMVTPLRPPDGQGVTVSMPFGQDGHLGEDWCTGPGDQTKDEPVYSISDGWVSMAMDCKNIWGKVVMICYRLPDGRWPPVMEVVYAQLGSIEVEQGTFVKKGQEIGKVGIVKAGNTPLYKAHLQWEIRQAVDLGLGGGFSDHPDGWLNPSDQLAAHRGARYKFPLKMTVLKKEDQANWGTESQ